MFLDGNKYHCTLQQKRIATIKKKSYANRFAEHGTLCLDGGHIQGTLLLYAHSLFEDCINKNEIEERPKELPCITNTV